MRLRRKTRSFRLEQEEGRLICVRANISDRLIGVSRISQRNNSASESIYARPKVCFRQAGCNLVRDVRSIHLLTRTGIDIEDHSIFCGDSEVALRRGTIAWRHRRICAGDARDACEHGNGEGQCEDNPGLLHSDGSIHLGRGDPLESQHFQWVNLPPERGTKVDFWGKHLGIFTAASPEGAGALPFTLKQCPQGNPGSFTSSCSLLGTLASVLRPSLLLSP